MAEIHPKRIRGNWKELEQGKECVRPHLDYDPENAMKKVFIGGSRKLGRLNRAIKERADNIVGQDFQILIGDANGADKAVQQYLAEKGYKNVIVFCMGDTCRNNIGKWETKAIASHRNKKDFSYFAVKDKEMSEQADYGFMLWDGKSKGTLNNIVNTLQRNKYVLVYFSPSKEFVTLKSPSDLEHLLQKCDQVAVQRFNHLLNIDERLGDPQKELNLS
jgi:hypothetical protein